MAAMYGRQAFVGRPELLSSVGSAVIMHLRSLMIVQSSQLSVSFFSSPFKMLYFKIY